MLSRLLFFLRTRFTSFVTHSSLLNFFILFHSCSSHARVFGKTLLHEFPISYYHSGFSPTVHLQVHKENPARDCDTSRITNNPARTKLNSLVIYGILCLVSKIFNIYVRNQMIHSMCIMDTIRQHGLAHDRDSVRECYCVTVIVVN